MDNYRIEELTEKVRQLEEKNEKKNGEIVALNQRVSDLEKLWNETKKRVAELEADLKVENKQVTESKELLTEEKSSTRYIGY